MPEISKEVAVAISRAMEASEAIEEALIRDYAELLYEETEKLLAELAGITLEELRGLPSPLNP